QPVERQQSMNTASTARHPIGRRAWPLLGLGLAALAGSCCGGLQTPASFYRAYLVSWLFVWNLALGSLALVMIHHLTGGVWGLAIRRAAEAQMRTLPLVALLFLPIVIGRAHLFPWADRAAAIQPLFRAVYLQPQLAGGRALACFALWITLA